MTNPDLGDQLARTLQSLEKATPQVLDLATRCERTDAILYGSVELFVLVACLYTVRWLWRWIQDQKKLKYDERADADLISATWVFMVVLSLGALVMLFLIPSKMDQLINARYWAIADLLARVKP